ncbi:MAG: response regulator transcription factor [Planctomycetaceae bacterium]|nr:response regulator transcription factor [Planctomycetaceae bacterium]
MSDAATDHPLPPSLPSSGQTRKTPVAQGVIRILIVDDHELLRQGLRELIGSQPDLEICGEALDEADALQQFRALQPDLMTVDISLGQGDGIDLVKRIHAESSTVRMLVLSMHDESLYAQRALRAGALGYVSKQAPSRTILEAIRSVLDGKLYLSPQLSQRLLQRAASGKLQESESMVETLSDRELEIFEQIGRGLQTRQIAETLKLSPKTVHSYRERLKQKLNVTTAGELTHQAVRWVLKDR